MPNNVQIAPADGKLGVLIPGIGAVSTTFIAGVEAVKRGTAEPIGSLTQLATIRLGKRTDGRTPMIKDFVPLAGLNDLVFGGWDIYEDTAYEAAVNAKVLEKTQLEELKEPLSAIKPMKAVFDSGIYSSHQRSLTSKKPRPRWTRRTCSWKISSSSAKPTTLPGT